MKQLTNYAHFPTEKKKILLNLKICSTKKYMTEKPEVKLASTIIYSGWWSVQ